MRRAGMAALLLLASAPVGAQTVPFDSSGTSVIMRSTAPYFEVGELSPELSTLCSSGLFNQDKINLLVIEFTGPVGYGVLGVAKGTGWNLRDPQKRAERKADYFFLRDGTTACRVYYFTEEMKQNQRRR